MTLDHPGAHLDHQLLMTMILVQTTAVQVLMEVPPVLQVVLPVVHPVVLLEHPGVTMTLDQALVDLLTIR